MTHHSYFTVLCKSEFEKNGQILLDGGQPLIVGETNYFFMDSGTGSHEYIVVDMVIEQRHIDNPYELIYDVINKIVSDAKVVINCLKTNNMDNPIMKRCIRCHEDDDRFEPDIEFCEDIISDITIREYRAKTYNEIEPDLYHDSICVVEHKFMDLKFEDIDYVRTCYGIVVILLGRNKIGMTFNTENVNWYGMDFDGYRRSKKYDDENNNLTIKDDSDLAKGLAVILRSEKGWTNLMNHYIEVIRRTDVERADWIQGIFDEALKINRLKFK